MTDCDNRQEAVRDACPRAGMNVKLPSKKRHEKRSDIDFKTERISVLAGKNSPLWGEKKQEILQ